MSRSDCAPCAIKLLLESERPIAHIAAELVMYPETLCKRARQAEAQADSVLRPDLPSSADREEIERSSGRTSSCAEPARLSNRPACFFVKELDEDRTM